MGSAACQRCQRVRDAYFAVCSEQKKLGCQERRLLLIAGASDGTPTLALPQTRTPSSQVAMRRAIAGLRAVGLIEVSAAEDRIREPAALLRKLDRKYLRPRRIRRTPFGDTLVTAYRRELEQGRPIRWLLHGIEARDAALAACRDCARR